MPIRKCPICSEPYEMYNMYAGDQSACAECRREARRQAERPTPGEEHRWDKRRRDWFEGGVPRGK